MSVTLGSYNKYEVWPVVTQEGLLSVSESMRSYSCTAQVYFEVIHGMFLLCNDIYVMIIFMIHSYDEWLVGL